MHYLDSWVNPTSVHKWRTCLECSYSAWSFLGQIQPGISRFSSPHAHAFKCWWHQICFQKRPDHAQRVTKISLATGCTRTVGAMRCAGVTSAEHFHHTAKIQGKQYNLYTHLIMSAVWQWPLLFTVFFSFLQGTFFKCKFVTEQCSDKQKLHICP